MTIAELSDCKLIVLSLEAHARELRKLYTKDCNEGLTFADEARIKALEDLVAHNAKTMKLNVEFNRDPRGAPIALYDEGIGGRTLRFG